MQDFLIACTLLSPLLMPILAWLLVIRPYCRRHGAGYTPGANWGITVWVDWQQASEIAARRGDRLMHRVSRVFLVWMLLIAVLWLLVVFLSVST